MNGVLLKSLIQEVLANMNRVFKLTILQPKFDDLYEKYKARGVQWDAEEERGRAERLRSITDKTGLDEELEHSAQKIRDENTRERARIEELKARRVISNGGNPLLYIVDRIIDVCVMRAGSERIEMHIDYLGVPDNLTQVTDVHSFFNKLKDYGCFATVDRVSNVWFVIMEPNVKKLHLYKNDLRRILESVTIQTDRAPENVTKLKSSLKSMDVKYDDGAAVLYVGSQKCQIPPYKNEHYFCRVMYEHDVNEIIDWSILYEKMTG